MLRLIDEPTSAALAVYGLDRPHMPLSGAKSSVVLSEQEQPQAATQASSVRWLTLIGFIGLAITMQGCAGRKQMGHSSPAQIQSMPWLCLL